MVTRARHSARAMNNTDLAEIRARLRAAAEDRRPAPRGPLGSLRGWLGPKRRPPLLGAPLPYEPRPAPASRRPAPDETGEEALPLDLPVRRNAFGQRPEPGEEPRPAVCIAPLTAAPPQVDDDDMIEAIRRRPSPLLRRIEEATETPFLPEDLADASGDDLERLYSEAGLAPCLAPPDPASAAPSPLERLERRLLEEHMLVNRVIAGA